MKHSEDGYWVSDVLFKTIDGAMAYSYEAIGYVEQKAMILEGEK